MAAASSQSPPLAASPEPMVRSPGENLDLRHPTPDLQSLQGAYVGNIERLETKAERMSSSGSELGEEIRKLHREQKLADSRRSSLKSPVTMDNFQPPTVRSRNTSTSSYAHSIVDLNTTARWGGYSPGGYVTSPIGSLGSGSLGLKRQTSVTRSSKLDQVIQPEEDMSGAPAVQNPVPMLNSPKPPSHRSRRDSIDDQQQHREQRQPQLMAGALVPDDNGDYLAALQFDGSLQMMPAEIGDLSHVDHVNQHRPGSAGSGDTYQQARVLFHDFDGVHYSPPTQEDILRGGRVSFLPHSLHPPPEAYPPPRDHMVFYPAPVPKMLNLPKRLSQMPTPAVQAKRRTQMLETLPPDARKSAVWLAGEAPGSTTNLKTSTPPAESSGTPKQRPNAEKKKSMAKLPPQLRASMYFDQKGSGQDVEVMGDSAADTLDSILNASALAPVNAFIDHPFAGHAGSAVYAKETVPQRRSTANLLETKNTEARKSRASILFGKKESSGDQPNKLQKRASQLSLAAQLEAAKESEEALHGHEDDEELSGDERRSIGDEEEDEMAEEEEQIHLPEPQFSGPPTTLLAELQMRKQQQRTRNRAAATAFPNGMHATLLELDAVAQIEKERRKGQRVALAWEDPAIKAREDEEEEEDDEIPLAMLFSVQNGLVHKADPLARDARDWDRPLGLIEKRELEDNEPLSKRRNRLKGFDPNRRPSPNKLHNGMVPPPSEIGLDGSVAAENEEEEEETLAQRIRRLKTQKALDTALDGVEARPLSNAFSSELLSQFGGLEVDQKDKDGKTTVPPEKTVTPGSEEEETLGQRRARLQREALERTQTLQLPVAGGSMTNNRLSMAWSQMQQQQIPQQVNQQQPVLKQTRSMADLLAAHPVGQNNQARKISNEAFVDSLPTGSLLQQNEMTQQRLKRGLFETNKRSSTFGLDLPLVDVGHADKDKDWDTPLGLLGQANAKNPRLSMMPQAAAPASFMGQNQNPMGVWSLQQQQMGMQMPMQMGMQMPQMGMGMGMGMNMGIGMGMNPMGMPGLYQQPNMAMSGLNMGAMGAMGMPVTYAAAAQMGAAGEAVMDQRQRELIDRWRQSIM